jgi:predicted Holliday junction resolvase-like endonuclease
MYVTKPGYLVIGSFLVSLLSVVIPLVALLVLTWFMVLYCISRIRTLRARVLLESREVEAMLLKEFAHIRSVLTDQETKLLALRKTSKLTLAEEELINEIDSALKIAETRVTKEVHDVTRLVSKK